MLFRSADPAAVDGCFGPADGPSPDALIIVPDAMLIQVAPRIAALGLERRVPVLGPFRDVPKAGGLLSYGPSILAMNRRSAFYIKRILAGAAPRDLPAEQPTEFALTLNLKTAQALGVKLPPQILAIADEVIE